MPKEISLFWICRAFHSPIVRETWRQFQNNKFLSQPSRSCIFFTLSCSHIFSSIFFKRAFKTYSCQKVGQGMECTNISFSIEVIWYYTHRTHHFKVIWEPIEYYSYKDNSYCDMGHDDHNSWTWDSTNCEYVYSMDSLSRLILFVPF